MALEQLRKELGINRAEICRRVGGMHHTVYCELERGTRSPLRHTRVNGRSGAEGWSSQAQRLAEFHGVLEEYLFPEHAREIATDPFEVFDLQDTQIWFTSPQYYVEQEELSGEVREALGTLEPREEKVLRMRFGIGEAHDFTLDEVAEEFEKSRERIRQMEAKALRKLRHPSRSKSLTLFVKEDHTKVTRYCPNCGQQREFLSKYCQGSECWVHTDEKYPKIAGKGWPGSDRKALITERYEWVEDCIDAYVKQIDKPWEPLPNWCPQKMPEDIGEFCREHEAWLEAEREKRRQYQKAAKKRAEKEQREWRAYMKKERARDKARSTFSEEFVVANENGYEQARLMVSPSWIRAMEEGHISMEIMGTTVKVIKEKL